MALQSYSCGNVVIDFKGAAWTGLLLNSSGPGTSRPFETITPSASPHVITEYLSLSSYLLLMVLDCSGCLKIRKVLKFREGFSVYSSTSAHLPSPPQFPKKIPVRLTAPTCWICSICPQMGCEHVLQCTRWLCSRKRMEKSDLTGSLRISRETLRLLMISHKRRTSTLLVVLSVWLVNKTFLQQWDLSSFEWQILMN